MIEVILGGILGILAALGACHLHNRDRSGW